MWLYKDGDTNIGGITEWAIKSFDKSKDKQLFMEHDIDNPASIGNFDVGLSDKKDEHPSRLSGGQTRYYSQTILNKKIEKYKQKLQIFRIFVTNTYILI